MLCREVGEKGLREIGEAFNISYAAVSHALNRLKATLAANRGPARSVAKSRESLIHYFKT